MDIRKLDQSDAPDLLDFLCRLDGEAKYMLYRPGERKVNGHDLRGHIKSLRSNSIILGAFERKVDSYGLVGYLALYGGRQARNSHFATLSCGVLKDYQRKGLATDLWIEAHEWAMENDIRIIELTVVEDNLPAIAVYKKWGFGFAGFRPGSFELDFEKGGKREYIGEFIMCKSVWHGGMAL